MRLAHRGAARHGGADGGRGGRVEEIDVERDVQDAVRRRDLVEELRQRPRDADLVDHPHVDQRRVAILERGAFLGVDAAQADHADLAHRHGGGQGREVVEALATGDVAQRRAVQVAARGAVGGVEIAMRVEPQHEERPLDLGGMGGHACHGAERQRVIAAHEDGKAVGRLFARGAHQGGGPADIERQLVDRAVAGRRDLDLVGGHVADVGDAVTERGERLGEAGGAVGVRAHEAAAGSLAAVHRGADEDAICHARIMAR